VSLLACRHCGAAVPVRTSAAAAATTQRHADIVLWTLLSFQFPTEQSNDRSSERESGATRPGVSKDAAHRV